MRLNIEEICEGTREYASEYDEENVTEIGVRPCDLESILFWVADIALRVESSMFKFDLVRDLRGSWDICANHASY